MSPFGTKRRKSVPARTSAFGGKAENICSIRALPVMTDTVEKVRSMAPPRNNRIDEADFLNRSCAFDAGFESMLLGDPPQNPFSTVSTHSGHCP
jgi:hypothetical protein